MAMAGGENVGKDKKIKPKQVGLYLTIKEDYST